MSIIYASIKRITTFGTNFRRYSSHLNTIEFKLLDVLNLLRIGPYLTDERHRIILNTLVEKTDLYEDLSRPRVESHTAFQT